MNNSIGKYLNEEYVFTAIMILSQRPFPNGDFPNVQFPKRKLPNCNIKGYLRRRGLQWGQALRLGQTWEVAACEITHLGNYPWEITAWKNAFGKYDFTNLYCHCRCQKLWTILFKLKICKINGIKKTKYPFFREVICKEFAPLFCLNRTLLFLHTVRPIKLWNRGRLL